MEKIDEDDCKNLNFLYGIQTYADTHRDTYIHTTSIVKGKQ